MLAGLFFLKESPRWLAKKDRHDEALASLAHTRCTTLDDPEILQELAEIRASIEEEFLATEGLTWKECLKPGVRGRFVQAIVLMTCQQFSGTNSIGYYAPQIFESIGISSANSSLFATGIYGTVKVITTGIFLIIGIEKLGRKLPLVAGALWMMAMMFIIGALLVSYPPDPKSTTVSSASIAMAVMIYLYVIGYSASWGPIPWGKSFSQQIFSETSNIANNDTSVYVSEIFPTRLRGIGVSTSSATQWLFNFCVTKFTPAAINNIGWKTFIMFGVFCFANALFSFFFIKETKGLKLEDIDILFGTVDVEQRRRDVEATLAEEKGVAGKAIERAEHAEHIQETVK